MTYQVNRVRSSVNDTIFPIHKLYILFTYIRYNNDPIIEPSDTPHPIGKSDECTFSN